MDDREKILKISVLNEVINLTKKYPNNMDLGFYIRQLIDNSEIKFKTIESDKSDPLFDYGNNYSKL